MKTSNKILLGMLLAGIGYLAWVQIALHIKYVNNDFTETATYNAYYYDEYKLNNINHARISGLGDCQVIFSDSTKLSVEKSGSDYIKFAISNDTLIIHGEYPSDRSGNRKPNRSPQNVRLYLPQNIDVAAFNSIINVKGNREEDNAYSCSFNLTDCGLFTRYNYGLDSLGRYFNNFFVTAKKNSEVIFFHNDHFKTLNVQLDHSLINDYHAKIEQPNITADSSSVVVMSGENINRLNTTAIRK